MAIQLYLPNFQLDESTAFHEITAFKYHLRDNDTRLGGKNLTIANEVREVTKTALLKGNTS